ncbi:hypothetical protein [Silanimonas sp.]|uniref:hypothetical protein n=1 Tax=Silanimonas sp. TaxID=1929290 RepID=UPI0022C43762|nr:hypothetical protein [Silanimonas sp.]MCZ8166668.1 hypothetical protein [Silanimonas sp.]
MFVIYANQICKFGINVFVRCSNGINTFFAQGAFFLSRLNAGLTSNFSDGVYVAAHLRNAFAVEISLLVAEMVSGSESQLEMTLGGLLKPSMRIVVEAPTRGWPPKRLPAEVEVPQRCEPSPVVRVAATIASKVGL